MPSNSASGHMHVHMALMRMTGSYMPVTESSTGKFHWLFTDYFSLSLSRYLLSITVRSISKVKKNNIQKDRKKEGECTHNTEGYVVSTNLNLCQTVLWDQVQSSHPDKIVYDSGT